MTRRRWVGCCAVLAVGLLVAGCRGATEGGSAPKAPGRGADESQARKAGADDRGASGVVESPANQRPVVLGIWIRPDPPTGSEPVQATARVWDKEGDSLTYGFTWVVNGETVEGVEGDVFPRQRIKRGDTLKVVVRASDGKQWSDPRDGTWKVVNGPPVITSVPPVAASLKEPIYVYAVVAKDPDGDAVAFSLKEGPSGMTVDPKTGRLAWAVDRASLGAKRRAVVAAKDSEGAEATQAFTVTVSAPEKQP